ncbi:MAG: hypothetical protein IJB34_01720 [Clostridia bacterium]|nr:hypothetical protein [Clostridia bacterium]
MSRSEQMKGVDEYGIDEGVEQAKQKVAAKKMMEEVKVTRKRSELQMKKEYARYKAALEKGDYKMANDALKMWQFIYKMNELADRFIVMLERVQTIQDLFNILQGTCEVFSQIMKLDNNLVFKDLKKNIKIFKRKLKQYEQQMDEVINFIDTIFDEPVNPIVKFFRKLFGKKEPSQEEIFKANQQKYAAALSTYESNMGEESTTSGAASAPTGTGAPAPAPSNNSGMPDGI